MFSKLLVVMAVTVAAVNAQAPPCVEACIGPAIVDVGCKPTDNKCLCESAEFLASVTVCLTDHCDSADISAAQALQSQQCSSGGTTITPTGPPTTTFSIPFTLSSSASGAATTTSSGSVSTSASSSDSGASTPNASNGGTTAPGTATSPTSTSTAATTSSSSAATSLGSNVVAAILAMFAGFLAI